VKAHANPPHVWVAPPRAIKGSREEKGKQEEEGGELVNAYFGEKGQHPPLMRKRGAFRRICEVAFREGSTQAGERGDMAARSARYGGTARFRLEGASAGEVNRKCTPYRDTDTRGLS